MSLNLNLPKVGQITTQPVGVMPMTVSTTPTNQQLAVVAPVGNLKPISLEELSDYGQKSMQGMASVSEKVTQQARGADTEEMGKLLGDLLVAAKGYDPSKLGGDKGISKLFQWGRSKAQQIQNQFTTVDTQVDQLLGQIDKQVVVFKNQIPTLESMKVEMQVFYEDLQKQIDEMERRIQWMVDNPPTVDPNDPFSAQEKSTWDQVIQMARKRVSDLANVQLLAQQLGPQIDMMKVNSVSLVQKFGDIKATTIPAWKQLLAAYIIQLQQKKGVEMTEAIDDAFNQAIMKGADLNKQNAVRIATSVNRSSIDMATLQYSHQKLLETFDEVQRINAEGQQRIAAERPALEQLSKELNQKIATGFKTT